MRAPLSSVWRFSAGGQGFSVMVASRAIMLSTTPAQVVLDPFAAQGVIGQVAKLWGRGGYVSRAHAEEALKAIRAEEEAKSD